MSSDFTGLLTCLSSCLRGATGLPMAPSGGDGGDVCVSVCTCVRLKIQMKIMCKFQHHLKNLSGLWRITTDLWKQRSQLKKPFHIGKNVKKKRKIA